MDSTKLNEWMQVVGIFALVASLIFVGLQMKQAQEIALSAAYQARAASSIDIDVASASSPEFTSGTAKLLRGEVEKISPSELVALEYFLGATFLRYENHHYQYELGFLPEEHWSRNISEMECYLSTPMYREMLDDWEFRDSFQRIVDGAAATAISNPRDCL